MIKTLLYFYRDEIWEYKFDYREKYLLEGITINPKWDSFTF